MARQQEREIRAQLSHDPGLLGGGCVSEPPCGVYGAGTGMLSWECSASPQPSSARCGRRRHVESKPGSPSPGHHTHPVLQHQLCSARGNGVCGEGRELLSPPLPRAAPFPPPTSLVSVWL